MHGPCVVTNPTLETLAHSLFKRACVSMDDLLQEEAELVRRRKVRQTQRAARKKRRAAKQRSRKSGSSPAFLMSFTYPRNPNQLKKEQKV